MRTLWSSIRMRSGRSRVGHLHFRHKLSPYLGAELRGRVVETWLRGEQVFGAREWSEKPRGRELVRR